MKSLNFYLTPEIVGSIKDAKKNNGYLFTSNIGSSFYPLMSLEADLYSGALVHLFNHPKNRELFKSNIAIVAYNKGKEHDQAKILRLLKVNYFSARPFNDMDKFLKIDEDKTYLYARAQLPGTKMEHFLLDISKAIDYSETKGFPEDIQKSLTGEKEALKKLWKYFENKESRARTESLNEIGKRENVINDVSQFYYRLGED
jgi:hypothetical protein